MHGISFVAFPLFGSTTMRPLIGQINGDISKYSVLLVVPKYYYALNGCQKIFAL
jgi:hypothetical protein